MNASWDDDRARRPPLSRYRASTEPAPASHSIHPRALMSGHLPHTIHTPDLFFSNPRPSSSPPPPVPPHPYNAPIPTHSYPPPIPPLPPGINIYRTMTAPPIPPKPASRSRPYTSFSASAASPTITSGPLVPATTQSIPQQNVASSDRNEDGLALAFALSQSVAHNEQRLRDKLSTQEEEDLARALKESMMITSIPSCSPVATETSFASPASGSTMHSQFHLEEDKLSIMVEPANSEMLAQDEALAIRLALEEAGTVVTPNTPRTISPPALRETSTLPDHTPETTHHRTSTPSSPNIHASGSVPQLPAYIDVVRTSTTPGSSSSAGPSTDDSNGGRSSSTSPHLPQNTEASHSHARDSFLMPSHSLNRASSTASLISSQNSISETNTIPNPAAPNVNQFVDPQLFLGVSIGFFAPPISTDLITTLAVMPNIISLPYGKCPPLHLQGPSWRHLLMLMARLSGTRLEATLEAVAVTKTEMKLRTVVQFVKPLRTSTEWRTIFYFTLDYPSPRSGDARQNVNALPYSYSLSTIPTLLREAVDTPISKTYTIPASDAVPYPTLPITFPNLAMYLHAALEESRRYINDSSSAHRKLAKMMQICYPSRAGDGFKDAPERSSVGGLFKRVIGRNNNRSTRTGGNEDTYELVTPFVPDEWG